MGYQFTGFFACAGASILQAALCRWPGCCGRLISKPFTGIGVEVPDEILTYRGDSEEEYKQA